MSQTFAISSVKLLQSVHCTLFCQLSQTVAKPSVKLSQSVHCTLFCQLSQTVAKPSVKLSQFVHRTLFCQLSQTVAKPLSNYRIAHRTPQTTALIDYVIETGCGWNLRIGLSFVSCRGNICLFQIYQSLHTWVWCVFRDHTYISAL